MKRKFARRVALLCLVGVVVPAAATVAVLVADEAATGDAGGAPKPVLAAGPAHVLAVVAILVAAAHLGGALANWLRQPRVVGQATAGLLLGPSLLGWLAPDVSRWLHSGGADPAVDMLANLGVIMFVFLIARELAEGGHFGGLRAFAVGQSMVAIPLLAGVGAAVLALNGFRPEGIDPLAYTLFIGLAMSATALPVLAHILSERRLLTSPVGALGVASAAFGDASLWAVLALILCFANNGDPATVLLRLGAAVVVAAVIWFGVRPLLRWALPANRDSVYAGPAFLMAGLLLCAFATDALGLHAIFGAFLFGLVVPGRSLVGRRVTVAADGLTQLLLLPLFFTAIGARADIRAIAHLDVLGLFALILVVAVATKVASAGWAGRMVGLTWRDSAALGVMMNCRGLTELVILNVGLTIGLIDTTMFTAFLAMALITTAATGPLLTLLGYAGESSSTEPVPEAVARDATA